MFNIDVLNNYMKNWLLLELDGGWQMILPDDDIKPHSKLVMTYPDKTKKAFVDDIECPCKPSVDFINKIITHNAFDGRK